MEEKEIECGRNNSFESSGSGWPVRCRMNRFNMPHDTLRKGTKIAMSRFRSWNYNSGFDMTMEHSVTERCLSMDFLKSIDFTWTKKDLFKSKVSL